MLIEQPLSPSLHDAHRSAVDDVNRWRGYCVEKYSRAEAALRAAIEVMLVHPDGAKLKRPSLFGQHVEVMALAVVADGPFAGPGSKVCAALARCTNGFAMRNIVTHSVSSVWLDRQGHWLWRYEFQPAGKGKGVVIGSLTQEEAKRLGGDLNSSIRSLEDHLQSFTRALEGPVTK